MHKRVDIPALAALIFISAVLIFSSCSRLPFVRPNPPEKPRKEPGAGDRSRHADDTVDSRRQPRKIYDFAEALEPEYNVGGQDADSLLPPDYRGTAVVVPTTAARVLLKQKVTSLVLYSLDTIDICTPTGNRNKPTRGRVLITTNRHGNTITLKLASGTHLKSTLPCTLLARSPHNYFEFDDSSYRGSMILASTPGSNVALINLIEVEEYLRGVVPLEIGRRPREQIEAVKAQAVAARTYTYRRIMERRGRSFDLYATVADQVYGGVRA
ncbi:MAG: hypothetical protein GF344_06700, partial [Chitinivibrionales bacterium]|nr:hypothetical protein [Chitinivibrionales bacterium]MBD3356616.1 hypothetical protein [Chitinivibrionales bacterium]